MPRRVVRRPDVAPSPAARVVRRPTESHDWSDRTTCVICMLYDNQVPSPLHARHSGPLWKNVPYCKQHSRMAQIAAAVTGMSVTVTPVEDQPRRVVRRP